MNKGAKSFLAYALLAALVVVGIALFAGAVMAYSAGNSSVSVNYALIIDYIAGRHYTPTCLGTCDLVFSLSYSGTNAPTSVAIDTNKLRTQFNWAKGQDKFQKSEIYYLNEYPEEVKDYSTVCSSYNTTGGFEGNWTYSYFSNCTQVESGSHLESRQELTSKLTGAAIKDLTQNLLRDKDLIFLLILVGMICITVIIHSYFKYGKKN